MDRHYESRKRKTRGVMVLAFLLILIIAVILAFFNTLEEKPEDPQQENEGDRTEIVYEMDNVNSKPYTL